MKNDKVYSKLISGIEKMAQEINRLHEQKIAQIEPEAKRLITSGSQDIEHITKILDDMFDQVLFGVGTELFFQLLNYLKTFAPYEAKEIQELYENLAGTFEDVVDTAGKLAKGLHSGQTDKAGKDYFKEHLCHVAEMGHTWKEKVVGYLHDVAEDTECSTKQVMQMLKDSCGDHLREEDAKEIHQALDLLNSHTASSRQEYLEKLKQSHLATKVKLNDLQHNMDLSRISNPTQKDFERIQRYKKEYRMVLEYLGPVLWEDED